MMKTKVEKVIIMPASRPPTRQQVIDSLHVHNLHEMNHTHAFFGNDKDSEDSLKYVHFEIFIDVCLHGGKLIRKIHSPLHFRFHACVHLEFVLTSF